MQAVFSTKAVCEAGCKQVGQKLQKMIVYRKSVAYMYFVYLSFPCSCIVLCGNITTCNALLNGDLIYLWTSCMCNVHVPVHSVRVLIFLFFFLTLS